MTIDRPLIPRGIIHVACEYSSIYNSLTLNADCRILANVPRLSWTPPGPPAALLHQISQGPPHIMELFMSFMGSWAFRRDGDRDHLLDTLTTGMTQWGYNGREFSNAVLRTARTLDGVRTEAHIIRTIPLVTFAFLYVL